MEFNLQTLEKILHQQATRWLILKETEEWKEGFEKKWKTRLEVLERMQATIHDGEGKARLVLIATIKEILGVRDNQVSLQER